VTKPIISTDLDPDDADAVGVDDVAAEPEERLWVVDPQTHGVRIDKALATHLAGLSRSWLQQLIESGDVSVNGASCRKPSARLKVGDCVRVFCRLPASVSAFEPEPMNLSVLYEDPHVMVIDKPVGLVVHPAAGHWTGTLLNGLLAHHRAAADLPRAGIVHRLDKDTSGLMVVAKTHAACDALVAQIAARDVHRVYVALAHGRMAAGTEQLVDQPVGRDLRNRLRMAVFPQGGQGTKAALTRVRVLDAQAGYSWVGCKLHTGRTHQIRVHLAWLGHPLVGDALYGGRPLPGLQRQALHAHVLAFQHPITGKLIRTESPVPVDMAQAVSSLGLHYNLAALWDEADGVPQSGSSYSSLAT